MCPCRRPALGVEFGTTMVESGTYSPSPYRFVIGGLTLWVHFAAGLSFQAVSPILPIIERDYDISHTTASLLVGMVMIISGLFGIPGGVIVVRLGLWRTYTLCWIMMGLLTLSALSPNFGVLLSLRIVFGLGMAAMLPATGPLIMQWFRPRELPIITSINLACLSLGIVVSVSTAAPLAGAIGWERVLGVFGSVGLVGTFFWLIFGKVREDVKGTAAPLRWDQIWEVVRDRNILLIGAADTACFSMYMALSSWLPTFYNEARGMSLTQAGFITSLLPFMGIFAVLLGGLLSLRIRQKRLFFIVPGVMAGVGSLGSYLIDSTAVTYVSVIVMGLGCWLYVPVLLTLPMELPGMTPRKVALAWGWLMTMPGIGTFLSPLVVGAMSDGLGTFIPGFLIFSILAWFLFVAGFLLPEIGTRIISVTGPQTPSIPAQD